MKSSRRMMAPTLVHGPRRRVGELPTVVPWTYGRARADGRPAQHLDDEERELERLPGVEPWVARGLVARAEILVGDHLRAAQALGDVLAGVLDVDAARVGAQPPVHLEEA